MLQPKAHFMNMMVEGPEWGKSRLIPTILQSITWRACAPTEKHLLGLGD